MCTRIRDHHRPQEMLSFPAYRKSGAQFAGVLGASVGVVYTIPCTTSDLPLQIRYGNQSQGLARLHGITPLPKLPFCRTALQLG